MKDFFKKCFSKENLTKFLFSFVWLALIIFVIDLVSKWAVQNSLHEGQKVALINNFLNVTLSYNTGASFSLLRDMRVFWIVISVVLSAVLIFIFVRYYKKFTNLQRASLALMIGGAFGNMVDRIFYWPSIVGFSGVIDWIDFQFGSWHFATFNIADAALVIGVLLIVIIEIVNLIKEAKMKAKRGDYDLSPAELEAKLKEEDAKNQNK